MTHLLFRFLFIALPLISGVFMPLFKFGDLGGLVSLFWGSIYGLGYFVSGYVFGGLRTHPTLILGGLVWPLVVCVLLFWISGKLWQNKTSTKIAGTGIFVLSLFIVITLTRASSPPFSSFPLYSLFHAAAY